MLEKNWYKRLELYITMVRIKSWGMGSALCIFSKHGHNKLNTLLLCHKFQCIYEDLLSSHLTDPK